MKILLVTAAGPQYGPFSTIEKRPPLGLGFLISKIRAAGHKVFFIDNYLEPSKFLEEGFLYKNNIDYFGIYASTICFRDTKIMLAKAQKQRESGLWKGKIIVGGPHTTVALQSIPGFVDFIVQGEGEAAIIEIIEGRVEGGLIRGERIRDLDKLPSPAWDEFVKLPYDFTTEWLKEKPVFTLNTSRGCPFPCAFCSVGSIWGKQYAFMSAEKIADDIVELQKKYNARAIYFREDNFTLNKKRVYEFCEVILKRGINVKWVCETRVDSLDEELMRLMHKAGARAFYLGVESGNQRILDLMKKEITIEQTVKVFSLCNKIGIKTSASFVVGIPSETENEILNTIYFSEKIKPTTRSINIFIGLPTSELYNNVLNNKMYEYEDDIGILYMKGHKELVNQIHGASDSEKYYNKSEEKINNIYDFQKVLANIANGALKASFYRFCARSSIKEKRGKKARKEAWLAIKCEPISLYAWFIFFISFINLNIVLNCYRTYFKTRRKFALALVWDKQKLEENK